MYRTTVQNIIAFPFYVSVFFILQINLSIYYPIQLIIQIVKYVYSVKICTENPTQVGILTIIHLKWTCS